MTVGEMLAYTKRFKEIMRCSSSLRDLRLASLMNDLEQAYEIPALRNKEFEKQHPFVMQLYKTVSEARSL
ncbi:hypothetical protein [Fervidibacillus albus]|uniref:Uncharacterized protein n=1 Tax=Fervidibacillus albus TaxID=2980026 RepID=A0A9E8LV85_9BACI|nr:hypothetical protein [Fervidibacillus albus]WAA10313.1 hypothetical protein OE104_02970 [Fervidibacillus albus]